MPRLFRRAFFLGMILLALHSCGGGERPLTILVPVAPRTLDPHFATTTVELSLLMNIFEALVVRRDDMTLGPGLAERWEIDGTRKIWTFHLRKEVEFTNGEPFGAEAVKYTFDRMVSGRLRPRITIPNRISFDQVEIVDDHTVRIHTKSPAATLPAWLVNAFILAPGHYSKTPPGEVSRKPVGTGPYKVSEWVEGDPVHMEANGKWWRGKPKIPEVVWRSVPQSSKRVEELDAGTADIITNIPPARGLMLVREGRGNQFKTVRGGRRIYIGLRQTYELFRDKRVRQAMNYAVDFGAIVRRILNGHGSRMATVVNPPHSDLSIRPYPYDPNKARGLLARAGLRDTDGDGILEKNGRPVAVKLDVPRARYFKGKEMAESVAENLRAVGIKAEIHPLDWPAYFSRRERKAFSPLYFHGFSSAFNAELDLGSLSPNLYANLTHWINAEFIESYNRLGRTFDPGKRKMISRRLQRIVREEAPWIFLWNQYDFYGLGPRVEWSPRADERIYLPSITLKETK